ncbi:MAG: VWA domain-containing protein [Oscillibacter sp.]|nr:VWA domain-containing protein [Oscillibacter sp.]MBQ9618216.1 VWA domain-containing protein [Oscillibacter sp.]
MPTTNELTDMPRKDLHIFYILDTSGSMEGTKISALNHAMDETIEVLRTLSKQNADARLKIAVLSFNTGAEWVTKNGPEYLEEHFEYEYLEAGGLTDMGAALRELNSKLSQREFLGSMMGALMPVMIFMTDGYATDNYEDALEEIRQNRWFARGTKIGFALGEDADVKMISSIVGNSEAVIKVTDNELFRRLMRFVSVTSSMVRSQSSTAENTPSGADILQQVDGIPEEAKVKLEKDDYNPETQMVEDDDWGDDKW